MRKSKNHFYLKKEIFYSERVIIVADNETLKQVVEFLVEKGFKKNDCNYNEEFLNLPTDRFRCGILLRYIEDATTSLKKLHFWFINRPADEKTSHSFEYTFSKTKTVFIKQNDFESNEEFWNELDMALSIINKKDQKQIIYNL